MSTNIYTKENLPFAALTIEQAGQFIKGIISEELRAITSKEPEPAKSESINIDDTVVFLQENGYPITKGSLYNLVSKKAIPCKKIGKRVVFSRSELISWLEQKTEKEVSKSESVLLLAESARKKSTSYSSKTNVNPKTKRS